MSTAMAIAVDAKHDWTSRALEYIKQVPGGNWFSADNLHADLPAPPDPHHVGRVFQLAEDQRLISRGPMDRGPRGSVRREWRRNEPFGVMVR
ncbi:hypothetical protein IW252_002626 [Zhihengliuella flava]|uniref:Uncharacterized protein n=1 Tax=Zhihengliuella flava TaxID=1285193 RepID=A0A931D7G6_9MICC|nr:hypothetical protein [Zhihengliuella flava]